MSLFLGKIHFWLFDKIKWFENLEEEVLKIAKERNMPVEEWVSYANLNFGEKTPNKPLDEIIDDLGEYVRYNERDKLKFEGKCKNGNFKYKRNYQ